MPDFCTIYIDMDSGTVLNGPIYRIEGVENDELEEVLSSDSAARDFANANGERL